MVKDHRELERYVHDLLKKKYSDYRPAGTLMSLNWMRRQKTYFLKEMIRHLERLAREQEDHE
jgi:hypothetical protein